ncbi:CARDB domain-containing protein [Archangium lansingense]|uniref:CARDB domain-containing protein n=1 Tax=Archangium lansingense TaxID=2995310 RepID=A0ABT4A744_9BACT|nr:CARDB domain-containing protein [Archangium lansinium]MCY1077477.1 hypothetical protein [Archangium lansinium]
MAAIDTTHVEPELREDNNVLVKGLMGVGNRADLVVTEVSAPSSLEYGQGFTASVKVCNQGTSPAGGYYYPYTTSRLELFLSMDAEVTLPDPSQPYYSLPADQRSLGYLELYETLYPAQCVTKSLYANADLPPAAMGMYGAYYLAAAIDSQQSEQELREDNNVFVKGLVGVGNRSDLVVTELKAPSSMRHGQSFTASVKVCNQGTTSTGGYYSTPRLELFLSMDSEVTLSDPSMPYSGPPADQMPIGSLDLYQTLQPGQCVTKSVQGNASVPPATMEMDGAYYLAAAIDTTHAEPELREDNNVFVSGLVGVGYRPDLVVTALSAPASLWNGQGFTASVKVCNQGHSTSSGSYSRSRLELFLSTDAEVTLPDPYMPYPGPQMDQMSIGYVELDPLSEGSCVTKSVYANADLPPAAMGENGAYYLAAAVDTTHVEQELREDNNVFVSGLVGVGNRSDLVVTEVSAPTNANSGQSFTASVKVCNQGTNPVSGTPRLELFLSADAELTLPDPYNPYPGPQMEQTSIGYVELYEPLYPAQCVTKSVPASANPPPTPQDQGPYYLVAAIDTNHAEQELREDNNVHVKGLMGVGYHSDLVVSEVSGPASIGPGQSFTASVKVCNQGTDSTSGSPSAVRLELFLSTDTELTLPDPYSPWPSTPLDQISIGYVELNQHLYAGQCLTQSVPGYASLPPQAQEDGAYYLVAAVDTNNAEQELREDNNVRVGGLVGVGNRSDLVVTEVSAPKSVEPGQSFTASVKVCNQGTGPTNSGSSYGPLLELFLSMDAELTLPDPNTPSPSPMDQIFIGSVELNQSLNPGQCVTKSVSANASLPPQAQGDGSYYLVAAVDPHHSEQELREDNNVHVSGLMGVGYRSDLVVTAVSAPLNVWNGQNFTASVKVCNQGTSPTSSGSYYGPQVELFLSTDAELTLPDPYSPWPSTPMDQISIGQVELNQSLNPGQCVTKSVPAYASLPPQAQGDGAYYLVAVVDSDHFEQELREDNNVYVSGLMGVGYRPDLVVTQVNAPANLGPGQNFTASVKVCNQGTEPSSSSPYDTRLELFLSMDAEVTLPDPSMPSPFPLVDQQSIGYVELSQRLYPGQCVAQSVPAYASLPPQAQGDGTYYLAAAIDTTHAEQELREDNNVHVSGPVGVGYRADLVVTQVNAPASVEPGQSFTASVKVCNQGTEPNNSHYDTRVELFLSTDAELTQPNPPMPPSGPVVDQQSIGYVELSQRLYPGQCVTQSVPANAWPPPDFMGDGALYLAAMVDTTHAEQELREDNNLHVSGLMGVGYRPDLVVTQVDAPANLEPGQSFTASVKVCNQGTAPTQNYSYWSEVELFLSTDDELTLPDPSNPPTSPSTDQHSIGNVQLEKSLFPGQCVTKSVLANAWPPPDFMGDGALYLAAMVDMNHAEQELREDNNVHVSGLMGVGHRPDLVVTGVSAPANMQDGQGFTASVKVCNQGTEPTNSYGAAVELFLSMNAELTLPAPGQPPPPGTMDQVSIGIDNLDEPLHPGQCVTKDMPASAYQPPAAQGDGAYYLVAVVDAHHSEQELREDNNVHVSGLVGVGYRPDLVVTGVSAPANMHDGQGFTASVKVCNQGTAPTNSYGAAVELFLSMDTELTLPSPGQPPPPGTMDQVSIGIDNLDEPLHPGQCVTKDMPASAYRPPAAQGDGAYYLVAVVDAHHSEQELREDNNVYVKGLVGVGYRPDLVVTGVSAPANLEDGQSFTASVKVCNQGTVPTNSYGTRVELFLSMDTELTLPAPGQPPPPGTQMDQAPIGGLDLDQPLQPNSCVTTSVLAHAYRPPAAQGAGAYYLVAAIDTNHSEQELREDNNVYVSGLMGVGYGPDLVVSEVSAPTNVEGGQNFTASVKVCNQGTSTTNSYGTAVELFLSMDTELTLPSPGQPPPPPGMTQDQQSIGGVNLTQNLQPGQCVTVSVPAYASPPPAAQGDGAYYLVAAIDPYQSEQELREDNNVHVKGLMGVGYRPDLVVTEVTAPASVMDGQPFTASVKVCNQGTTPTQSYSYGAALELFLSMDTELTLPSPGQPPPPPGMLMEQAPIGYVNLDQPVQPGSCVTKDVSANAYRPPAAQGDGAYYLVAAIDTNHAEQELREDNNVHVSGLMGVGYMADLVVTEVTSPASMQSWQSYTATVKVCNQGTVASQGTAWLQVLLSTDDQLTMPAPGNPMFDQTTIGSIDVEPLQPGSCVTKDVSVYASPPPGSQVQGTYYLGTLIDMERWVQELREDNNIRTERIVELTP